MAKVVFLHGEENVELREELIIRASNAVTTRYGDTIDFTAVKLGETKESKEEVVKYLSSIIGLFIIIYDVCAFNEDYVYGFLDAANVSEDVKGIFSLGEFEYYNNFRFRTEF